MTEKRTCRHCGEEKPLDQMYVHRTRDMGAVISSWCTVCRNQAMKSRAKS